MKTILNYTNNLIEELQQEGIIDAFTSGRDNKKGFKPDNNYEKAAHFVGKNVVRNISAISKRFVSDEVRQARREKFKTKAAAAARTRKADAQIKAAGI